MILFLTSSPFVPNAEGPVLSNANGFVDNLRSVLPSGGQMLFLCSDPDRRDLTCRFGADLLIALAREDICFSGYQVLDGENRDQAEELVACSDFIVLAGGHVPTQNRFFQEIGLRQLLEGWEGVVMGISAGSMNCAHLVYAQPEEPGESDPAFPRFLPGLGLTGVNILPHYQQVKDNILDGVRLFEDITYGDSFGNCFFALPDGSYIYQDDTQLLLFGQSWCIRDGMCQPLIQEGEVLNLADFS